MKRKTIIIMCVTVGAALSVSAAAAGGVLHSIKKETGALSPQKLQQIEQIRALPKETRMSQLKQQLSNQAFINLLRSLGYYEDELNQAMAKLIRLASIYSFTPEELEQIYQMAQDGYDLQKTLDIFEFAMDTDHPRDFSYVKQLFDYANKHHIMGKNWIETAFNGMTNYRGGALTEDDIRQYIKQGLTVEEISAANIMSRSGKKTIQQLLNERVEGKEWGEIIQPVYASRGLKAEDFEENQTLPALYSRIVKADVTGLSAKEVQANPQAAEQVISEKNSIARQVMDSLSITENADADQVVAAAQAKLPAVAPDKLRTLLRSGHTIRELEKLQGEANARGINLEDIAAKEASAWE